MTKDILEKIELAKNLHYCYKRMIDIYFESDEDKERHRIFMDEIRTKYNDLLRELINNDNHPYWIIDKIAGVE